jgi:hypothetical protein
MIPMDVPGIEERLKRRRKPIPGQDAVAFVPLDALHKGVRRYELMIALPEAVPEDQHVIIVQ